MYRERREPTQIPKIRVPHAWYTASHTTAAAGAIALLGGQASWVDIKTVSRMTQAQMLEAMGTLREDGLVEQRGDVWVLAENRQTEIIRAKAKAFREAYKEEPK